MANTIPETGPENRNGTEQKVPYVIVVPEAWETYRALRQYLRSDLLGTLVGKRKDVPLRQEELYTLVRPEENPDSSERTEICSMCGKEFVPVRWLDITNETFLSNVERGMTLKEAAESAGVLIFGKYYFNPDMEFGYGAFCGPAYAFNLKTNSYYVSRTSCCGKMKVAHPQEYWGQCLIDVEAEREEFEAEQQRQLEIKRLEERRRQEYATSFFNRSGKAAMNGRRRP